MVERPVKKYPVVGACGLQCGLCPAYHREGTSRCPGCCGQDFFQKHPTCKFITCAVKQRGLETCALCSDWESCEKIAKLFDDASRGDSIISYKPIPSNHVFIRKHGIEELARLITERQKVLKYLIDNYNDGRSRTFYCTSCQLLPLDRLQRTVETASKELSGVADAKEKATAMRAAITKLADSLQICLKLRK